MDNRIILTGDAAREFHERMYHVDIDAIKSRNRFIDNIDCWADKDGVLSINIDDLNLNFGNKDGEEKVNDL